MQSRKRPARFTMSVFPSLGWRQFMSRSTGLAALFVAAVAALPAPAQATLRWRFDEGKPFYVEWKAHKEQWQSWLGAQTHTPREARIVLRLTPLEGRPGGGVVLAVRVVALKNHVPGGPDDASARSLEGCDLRVTLDGRLRVPRVDGFDSVVPRFLGTGAPPAAQA